MPDELSRIRRNYLALYDAAQDCRPSMRYLVNLLANHLPAELWRAEDVQGAISRVRSFLNLEGN